MSRRSDSNIIVLVLMALGALLVGIFKVIEAIFQSFTKSSPSIPSSTPISFSKTDYQAQKEARWKREREERERKQKLEDARMSSLKEKYKQTSERDLIFDDSLKGSDKEILLRELFKYSYSEAHELLQTAEKQAKKAKLSKAKKDISRKAFELYGGIPSDDKRTAIPDDIKQYVWQRDKGQCAKCGNKEDLEFDHVIPFSKGGSNTARNIQILCQNCNRLKSDGVV